MENKKSSDPIVEILRRLIDGIGNPSELVEMLSLIDEMDSKSKEIRDFNISKTIGVREIKDIEASVANEIIEYCGNEIPELEEMLNKAIECKEKFLNEHSDEKHDKLYESLSEQLYINLEASIMMTESTIRGTNDLTEPLKANMDIINLTHTYPNNNSKAE